MQGSKKWVRGGLAAVCMILLGATLAMGAGMTVPAGATISLGSGKLDLGCSDLVIQNTGTLAVNSGQLIQRHMENQAGGTLNGGSGNIDVFGNWTNHGTFVAGSGTVSLLDGCGLLTASINGESDFCNLVIASSTGKTIVFEANKTQGIECSMDFTGVDGNLLVIRSSVAGTPAFVDLAEGATQHHDYENVADMVGTGQEIAPGPPQNYNSVDAGGNYRWFSRPPIPTLSQWGFALLAMLLLAMGWRVMRRSRPLAC